MPILLDATMTKAHFFTTFIPEKVGGPCLLARVKEAHAFPCERINPVSLCTFYNCLHILQANQRFIS